MKSFTTTQDMTQYEVSQDYCEPYLGATHDDLQAARFNKYDTYIDKNEFFVYDDVNHKYNIYRRVEYIENPSNAYIDTDVLMTNKTRIETILKCNRRLAQMTLFGVMDRVNGDVYTNGQRNGSTLFAFSMADASDGGDWISTGVYSANKLKFIYDTTYTKSAQENLFGLTIYNEDGTLLKYTSPKYYINAYSTSQASICICTANPTLSANGGVGVGRFAPLNVYYFKIINTNNNTIVRDFIPVKRINDNVYGLWDKVEGKFYISPNGTQFTGGLK